MDFYIALFSDANATKEVQYIPYRRIPVVMGVHQGCVCNMNAVNFPTVLGGSDVIIRSFRIMTHQTDAATSENTCVIGQLSSGALRAGTGCSLHMQERSIHVRDMDSYVPGKLPDGPLLEIPTLTQQMDGTAKAIRDTPSLPKPESPQQAEQTEPSLDDLLHPTFENPLGD